jgi:hypothetical protein
MIVIEKDCFEPVFQGDVMIMRIPASELPAEAKKLDSNIVAHSETDHHHVANYAEVLGGIDPMVMFLKAKDKHVDIVHQREFDTHETYRFYSDPGDCFIIKRQRESTPEGWRQVAD